MNNTPKIIVASTIAADGMKIEGVVISVGLEGTKNCWRAEACVDDTSMAFSHHHNRSNAEQWANSMQKTYLGVHGGTK